MSVYQRIDETRKAKGVTLTHLNELIGGYRGKLTEVKNGKTTLTRDELEKISVALHVSTDYLLGNTDDPQPLSEIVGDARKDNPLQERDGLSEMEQKVLNLFHQFPEAEWDNMLLAVEIALRSKGLLQ